MAYSFDLIELYKHVANNIDAILRGTKPGHIPIYQVTKFELSINLKTAKQLGLSVPPGLVAIVNKRTVRLWHFCMDRPCVASWI